MVADISRLLRIEWYSHIIAVLSTISSGSVSVRGINMNLLKNSINAQNGDVVCQVANNFQFDKAQAMGAMAKKRIGKTSEGQAEDIGGMQTGFLDADKDGLALDHIMGMA